ncbi:MXAN_6652 family MXYO-CTERM-anchored protein [Melittangium boletus]|uniref:MXAN_6652 family MXYO-CTERM-anchored protein n=1 Tax=Melittangium boletus TaxID=83453 RepID=UPI003DA555A8
MRLVSGGALALALSVLSPSAFAYPTGIAGFSGKSGANCTTCHVSGAAVPTVTLSGPPSLAAGATGQYTLVIRGGPAVVGGAGIAVSGTGASLSPVTGAGLVPSSGELVQSPPKAFTTGEVRFDFSLVAPASAGTVTLFAAGNSADGDGGNSGDGVATTKLDVTVTGGGGETPAPPEPVQEEKGGCSTSGGAPLALLALGVAAAWARRTRPAAR